MIGVFGGTGKIGGEVVKALRAKGVAFKCIVRDSQAAMQKLGGDVRIPLSARYSTLRRPVRSCIKTL